MKHLRSFALIAVLGIALAAGAAFAQSGPGGDGGRRSHVRQGGFARDAGLPLRALTLTDAQQQQIRTLVQQHREQNRDVASKLRAAREAQRKAAHATPVDEQAIRAAVQDGAAAQAELAVRHARLRAEILALLTPEQQAHAAKLQAERATRRSRERMQQRQ